MLDLLGKIQCCLWDSIREMGMSFVCYFRFVELLGTGFIGEMAMSFV
jgi:hypothetical protein